MRDDWEFWFAWKPVKTVSGKWVWLESIYRKETWAQRRDGQGFTHWVVYGTLFDVIKD